MYKKIAIDTYYFGEEKARTVGVVFNDFSDPNPSEVITVWTTEFEPYQPGQFYKRELPCILDCLAQVDLREYDTIILDGFYRLKGEDDKEWPGLGEHLVEVLTENGSLHPDLNVWCVAKTNFGKASDISIPILRGTSKSPLYVQAMRDQGGAAVLVKNMAGDYRLPGILKTLDKETKKK